MWQGTVSSFCVYFILGVGEVSYSATRQKWHEIAHIKNKVTQGFQPGPKSCAWPFRPVQAAVRLARKAALLHQPCTIQHSAVFWRVRIQNWLHRPGGSRAGVHLLPGLSVWMSLYSFLVLSTKTFIPRAPTKASFLPPDAAFSAPRPFPAPFFSS